MRVPIGVLLIFCTAILGSVLLGQTERKRNAESESGVQEVRIAAHVTYRRLNGALESRTDERVARLLERLSNPAQVSADSAGRVEPARTERLPFGLVTRDYFPSAEELVTVRIQEDGSFSAVCSPITEVADLLSEEEEVVNDD